MAHPITVRTTLGLRVGAGRVTPQTAALLFRRQGRRFFIPAERSLQPPSAVRSAASVSISSERPNRQRRGTTPLQRNLPTSWRLVDLGMRGSGPSVLDTK